MRSTSPGEQVATERRFEEARLGREWNVEVVPRGVEILFRTAAGRAVDGRAGRGRRVKVIRRIGVDDAKVIAGRHDRQEIARSRGRTGTARRDASGAVFHGAISANPLQASAMFHGQTATLRDSAKGEKAKRIPAWRTSADHAAILRVAGMIASAAVPISRRAMPTTANRTIS